MSDPVSALGGRSFDGVVTVTEAGLQGLITLRGDHNAKALQKAVKALTGRDLPGQRKVVGNADHTVAWLSPDELLILCPYNQASAGVGALTTALDGTHALVVNVSDAHACFDLKGAGLREVIAKLAPVDMAPAALPVAEIRRTRLAQAHAAFWLTEAGRARVLCPRSVAPYVMGLLCNAAQPGSEVGFF